MISLSTIDTNKPSNQSETDQFILQIYNSVETWIIK